MPGTDAASSGAGSATIAKQNEILTNVATVDTKITPGDYTEDTLNDAQTSVTLTPTRKGKLFLYAFIDGLTNLNDDFDIILEVKDNDGVNKTYSSISVKADATGDYDPNITEILSFEGIPVSIVDNAAIRIVRNSVTDRNIPIRYRFE